MWRRKGETMDLRRSRWILGVVLASIAVAGTPAGADEPNFTEEQKIDFLQHAKVIASKPEKKGKSDALHLTLSDGKVTYDASFQPIDERKIHGPGPHGGTELNFRDYWGYDMDANLTNVLITKDWKIWRIDFSRGFRLQHDLKDPKDLVQCDRQVLSKLRQLSYDQVFDATKPYLSKDEVKALIARRDKMVAYFDKLIAQKGESQVLY